MPQIYGYIVWGGICISFFAPIILFIIAYRRSQMQILFGIIILIVSIFACMIVGIGISFLAAEELQAIVALPYIQTALQEQCQGRLLITSRQEFSVGSAIRWASKKDNVACFFDNVKWKCDCKN